MFSRPLLSRVLCSHGPVFPRSYVSRVLYSRGPMFPGCYIPEVLCFKGAIFPRAMFPMSVIGLTTNGLNLLTVDFPVCLKGVIEVVTMEFPLFLTRCCPNGNFVFPMGHPGRCFPQEKPSAAESRYPTLSNYKVNDESLRVCVTHRTVTWTTRSLTCARGHSYACVYTRGLHMGTPTTSQHNAFDSEKLSQMVQGWKLGSLALEPDALMTCVYWLTPDFPVNNKG